MANDATAVWDVESLAAALSPPDFPDETFDSSNAELHRLVTWKRNFVVSVLAGLSTVPDFHANGIRLDWLQRLVLAHSQGKRKPPSAELSRALNAGLDRAKVLRLEDPNEDLFCDVIVAQRGNFRILSGQWETASPYTQTLLEAYESLPPAPTKAAVLESVYSILRLSEEIAERASVDRDIPSGNNPNGFMRVPSDEALRCLARRVRFTDIELDRLGVSKGALAPFFLSLEQHQFISDRPPGETPLDFYPLLDTEIGVVVASPTTISLAVRALLVVTARRGGMEDDLLARMLVEQQLYSEATGFWPLPSLQLSPPNRVSLRAGVCQYEQGRFLHVIQVSATFEDFPERGFASVRELSQKANQSIADDVWRFWQFLERGDHRSSATVLLLSGWGASHRVAPPIDDDKAPKGWRCLALSFADAAVLGTCEDGGFRDLCRILEQVGRLEKDGFTFRNLSGILNLFGFWRMTDGNLIPEHLQEVQPPSYIGIPTDALLAPRVEAAKKRDLRALPLPDGTVTIVQRIDWSDGSDLRPIYASLKHLAEKRLLGAVLIGNQVWWVESVAGGAETNEWLYRLWHSVLQWLDTIGATICNLFPQAFPGGAASVLISIPDASTFDAIDTSRLKESELAETIVDTQDGSGRQALITVLPEWIKHVGRLENVAEVELIAAILCQLAVGHRATRDQLRTAVLDAIGSRDWRWLHTHEVLTPLDRLASSGLIDHFREIPMSALSLAKCGSIWGFRSRAAGLEINGESDCKQLPYQLSRPHTERTNLRCEELRSRKIDRRLCQQVSGRASGGIAMAAYHKSA